MTFEQLLTIMDRHLEDFGEAAKVVLEGFVREQAAKLGRQPLCLEVGTWCGYTGLSMAATGASVICIDTFRASDPQTCERGVAIGGSTLERFIANTLACTQRGPMLGIVAESTDAARMIPDGSLDLIFIDGAHEEPAVRADLAAWHPKLRPTGILCGHDISQASVLGPVRELAGALSRTVTQFDAQVWRIM